MRATEQQGEKSWIIEQYLKEKAGWYFVKAEAWGSGFRGGSNLQSIIDNSKSGYLPAEVVIVISSKEVYALERAENLYPGCGSSSNYKTRDEYENELIKSLILTMDLVILAGYIRVLSPHFVRAFQSRIMNIHPALMPSFYGEGYYGEKVHKPSGLWYQRK